MEIIHDGQCGRCRYFGAQHAEDAAIVGIRRSGEADPIYIDECSQPQNKTLGLMVSAFSGCQAFSPFERESRKTGATGPVPEKGEDGRVGDLPFT